MEGIEYIKKVVREFGDFTIGSLEAESSPLVNSMGKDNIQLAEGFFESGIEAVTYVHETEVSEDFIAYEDLDKDVIDEIVLLAKHWEDLNE